MLKDRNSSFFECPKGPFACIRRSVVLLEIKRDLVVFKSIGIVVLNIEGIMEWN
jgi:hypothetical protein